MLLNIACVRRVCLLQEYSALSIFEIFRRDIIFSHEGMEIGSFHPNPFGRARNISIACFKGFHQKGLLDMSKRLLQEMLLDRLQFINGFRDGISHPGAFHLHMFQQINNLVEKVLSIFLRLQLNSVENLLKMQIRKSSET